MRYNTVEFMQGTRTFLCLGGWDARCWGCGSALKK